MYLHSSIFLVKGDLMKRFALALIALLALASTAVGQTTTLNQNTRWTGADGFLRTGKTSGYDYTLQGWDVNDATWRSFGVVTAGNTPSLALSKPSGGSFTITSASTYVGTVVSVDTFSATAEQVGDYVICNTGDAGAQVITLPDAVAGMRVTVVLTAAQDVDINPQTADQILALTNAAGDAISSAATIGNFITLVAVDGTNWVAVGASGTWTDVN